MKIVVLEKSTFTIGDIDLSPLTNLGCVEIYDILPLDEIKKVAKDADAIICNKTLFNKEFIDNFKNLKYIGLTATGYNNVDIAYAKQKGIKVANVPNYSTNNVAQQVLAFILDYANKINVYDNSVKAGDWIKSKTFSYFDKPIIELNGKTLGVFGYGNIGKKVASIADAFGMNVVIYSRTKEDSKFTFIDNKDEFFKICDFISIHCPLNEQTYHLINEKTLSLMKKTAVLINTSRGDVVDEFALKNALDNGVIAHAYLDVLSKEPMSIDCPLINCKNITFNPHVAWAAKEARQRVINITAENLLCFMNSKPQNIVND